MTGKNVILIGMPGAGKSTVGVVLAKKLPEQKWMKDSLMAVAMVVAMVVAVIVF